MIGSRRTFVGAFTYLPLAAATPGRLKQLLAVTPSGEGYWSMVAGQFPFRAGKIPMNAANLCPSPRVVSECVAELTRDEDSDISNPNRSKFNALADEARKKVAEHIGVSPDEIALVRNTSEANNVVNNGVQLAAGDEVVLWDQNHQCNNAAWDVRASRFGFKVKRVTLPTHTVSRSDRETV
jgi:selenocysteine lyase/cysteine desulfurase